MTIENESITGLQKMITIVSWEEEWTDNKSEEWLKGDKRNWCCGITVIVVTTARAESTIETTIVTTTRAESTIVIAENK